MNQPASDAAAVRQILRHLRIDGAVVTQIVTEEETIDVPARADEATIMSYLMETGVETITFSRGYETVSVTLVYGNSPEEIVYGVGPEGPMATLIEELTETWQLPWGE